MVTVSQIAVNLSAQTAAFESGMKKAKSLTKSFEVDFKAIGNIASGITLANGINNLTSAFHGFIAAQNQLIDDNAKLSDVLGVATGKLAGLQLAGDLAGVGADELGANLIKLQKNIGDAVRDGGELAEKFDKMGLSAQELAAIPLDQALQVIANNLSKVENAAIRNSMAMELFGKKGAKFTSVLAAGGAGLQEMQDKAEKLGLAVNRLDAAKVEAMNDSFTLLTASLKGTATALLVNVAPAITAITEKITEMAAASNRLRHNAVDPGGVIDKWANIGKNAPKIDTAGIMKQLNEIQLDRGFTDADVAGVFEKTITPAERLATELEKLNRMAEEGAIDFDTYGRRWEQLFDEFGKSPIGETLDKLAEQADALGKSDAQKAFDQFLNAGASNEQLDELLDLLEEIDTKTKAMEQKDFAAGIIESTKTPMEKYIEHTDKLRKALDSKNITQTVFDRAMVQAEELLDKSKVIGERMESVRGEVNLGAAFGSQEAAGRIDAFRRSGSGGADRTLQDMLRENRDQTKLQRDLPKNIAAELRGVIGAADF